MTLRFNAVAGAAALAAAAAPACAADAAAPTQPVSALLAQAASAPAPAASAAVTLDRVEVRGTRERLDAARNSLSPETGSTVYRFDKADLDKLPLGNATPLNQVLLQAPGVVADSFGQLHVRGDHSNLQYRIDGVVIPEAIAGFGQTLDTRFADRINVLTGALPAQFGYRTAGVVDIRTRGANLANGGNVSLLVGSRGHVEPSFDVGGTAGDFQYFATGSFLQNRIGIENPTDRSSAIHDDTRQGKGFAYLSQLLGEQSRISLLLGTAASRFQIPNSPGQTPAFDLAGATPPDSSMLDANQHERNDFQVVAFQSRLATGADYQVSIFNRRSVVDYRPDPIGDLTYNGVAATIRRQNVAQGLQLDASQPLSEQHTLRAGLFLQHERGTVTNASTVFPANDDGDQTSNVPLTIQDDGRIGGHLYGVYLQDEWTPIANLTVNYGVRYDKVNTVSNESQWSPRLGAVYQLGRDTRVHAGYARYFTPPPTEKIDTTSVAKFLGTTNALPSDANTAVQAERSHYFDAGVSEQLTPEITVGLDGYYRKVRHLQDEGQFGNALIYSAFNYAQGRIYGLELSGSYRSTRLSAYGNLAYGSARGKGIETGQFNFDNDELAYITNHWVHLDHEQRLTGSAGVSYRWGAATTLGTDLIAGSGLRRGFANTDHLGGYTQVNAYGAQTFMTDAIGRFDLRLSVLNLFDRSYQLRDGSGIGVGASQYGLRRTVYLALNKPFTF